MVLEVGVYRTKNITSILELAEYASIFKWLPSSCLNAENADI